MIGYRTGSSVCRWCYCWLPADISAGNDSTDNNGFLTNVCQKSPSTSWNRSFLHLLPFYRFLLPSFSFPQFCNCWNSPVVLSRLFPALQSYWIPLIPSSFLSSLHCQSCSLWGKKDIFSCRVERLGHPPPHTPAHHHLSPTPLHLSIKHLCSSLLCPIQLSPDYFHHLIPLPALMGQPFWKKGGNSAVIQQLSIRMGICSFLSLSEFLCG